MRTLAILFFSTILCSPLLAQIDATQPPPNQHAILTLQGKGAQVFGCHQVGTDFQWVFQAPVARLFDTSGNEVGTHGEGPVWTYQDSSSIQGQPLASSPAPDAANIPSLLLKAIKPQRTGVLTTVEYIRRSDTQGGAAPKTGCDAAHEGTLSYVPYTATYTFYNAKS